MHLRDLQWDNSGVRIRLKTSQTDQGARGQCTVGGLGRNCPCAFLCFYLQPWPRGSFLLLVHSNRSPLTQFQFEAEFKKVRSNQAVKGEGYIPFILNWGGFLSSHNWFWLQGHPILCLISLVRCSSLVFYSRFSTM